MEVAKSVLLSVGILVFVLTVFVSAKTLLWLGVRAPVEADS